MLGSFAAWGRTFSQKAVFLFEEATCPVQLCCLGQNYWQKIDFFLKKPLVPGSFAAWGRTFRRKLMFLKKPLVPGSFAAWGRTFSQKAVFVFEVATCPGQLRCLGHNLWQTIDFFLKKPLVPGSFAAWGRTFFQKIDSFLEEATCPGQLRCPGQLFLTLFEKKNTDFF